MCGIAGFFNHLPSSQPEPKTLDRMLDSILHRGPDSRGKFSSHGYHAGMVRLSINDLHSGDQPLFNRDRSVALLYNGEIYNSPALRKDLEAKGYVFKTHSDGEVICHLYEEMGERLFEKLDGMFAAALWIEKENKLILARDLPGEKPLYYSELPGNQIVFASEIKALLRFPGLDRTLNTQAIWDFPTFLWIPQPATVFKSVKSLPRGHLLVCTEKTISLKPYANLFERADASPLSDEDAVAETRQVVSQAIESRLLSDVPVGSFLSGGLDSSIVATVARKHLSTLHTFTIGFEDLSDPYHGKADESQDAEWYARKLGTIHKTVRITANEFREDLKRFCIHGDQPFSVSSGLGILSVARAAREAGVKVLLSGDGADEAFGGYSWYEQLPLKTTALNTDQVSMQDFGLPLETRLKKLSGYPAPFRAWAWHYYASEAEKKTLFHPDLFAESRPSSRHFEAWNPSPEWTPEQFIAQDRDFYFTNEMLQKLDRMTMAFSVEGRVPFAAPSVTAHARRLRYNQMVRGGTLKWALRQAFSDVLPAEVSQRPKHGFNVPIDHWIKNEWSDLFEQTFSKDSSLARHGLLHPQAMNTARAMRDNPKRLNGHSLFSLIMLNQWLDEFWGTE